MKKTIYTLLLLFSCRCLFANTETIERLESLALESFDHDAWRTSIDEDAVSMYYLWPGIDGLIALYEATGKSEYVAYCVDYCLTYRDYGVDVNSDGYLDWYSSWIESYSHHHVEYRAGDGIARTVEMIYSDEKLMNEFGSEYLILKDLLEKHVWEKWTGGYSNHAATNTCTHFIGRFGIIALALHHITGDEEYLDYLDERGTVLKNGLHLDDDGSYYWYIYADGNSDIVDTSHAGDTVNFISRAYDLDKVFTMDDIQRLRNTLSNKIWNGEHTPPRFFDYVDGSGSLGIMGKNQGGWINLAPYDASVKELYTELINYPEEFHTNDMIVVQILGHLARTYKDSIEPAAPRGLKIRH